MKVKTLPAILALSLVSSVATAENYRAEVGLKYTDYENSDSTKLYGEFHFSEVNTNSHPLKEAAFLEKSNNVNAAYIAADGGDQQKIAVEFFIGDWFYIAPAYTNTSPDVGSSDGVFSADLGLTPVNGMLITTSVPEEDYEFNLDMKYVTPLSGGTALNVELGYQDGGDGDDTISAGADYYFTSTFSLGAKIADSADTAYTLRANCFFTGKFQAGLGFTSADDADALYVDASFRF